jgi:hypothetical protein
MGWQITDPVQPYFLYPMAPVTWPNPHPPIGKYNGPAQIYLLGELLEPVCVELRKLCEKRAKNS